MFIIDIVSLGNYSFRYLKYLKAILHQDTYKNKKETKITDRLWTDVFGKNGLQEGEIPNHSTTLRVPTVLIQLSHFKVYNDNKTLGRIQTEDVSADKRIFSTGMIAQTFEDCLNV